MKHLLTLSFEFKTPVLKLLVVLLMVSSCSAPKRSIETPVVLHTPAPKFIRPHMVVIDAGHGGEEPGAIRKEAPALVEKTLSLVTAQEVAQILRSKGYRVAMTRTGDQTMKLLDRVHFAEIRKADAFISIHYNSCSKPSVRGIEIYYYKNEKPNFRQKESEKMGKLVLDSLVRATKSPSRGLRHGDFCVIRETKMPAILVEGGYLTSLEESKRLKMKTYIKRIAYGIAHGVDAYLKQSV